LEGLSFELILANINKNILKVQLPMYASCIEPKGKVFLSGFFETDVDELVTFAAPLGLTVVQVFKKETWAAIELEKSSQ
jgi:ribosomal protein L11 methyltransferase